MKFRLILMLVTCQILNLPAETASCWQKLSWSEPAVITRCYRFHFSEYPNENHLIRKLNPKEHNSFEIAIYPLSQLKSSLLELGSNPAEPSTFISYKAADSNYAARLDIQVRTGADFSSDLEDRDYSFLHHGVVIKGNLADRLFLYGDWWSGHYGSDLDYALETSPLLDSWYQYDDDREKIYHDNLRGKLLYSLPYLSVGLGRGQYQLGSSISGSIILDTQGNDYGYISLDFRIGTLLFSQLQAKLIADSTTTVSDQIEEYPEKYLAVHRLEWLPSPRFRFFLGEAVIYGNRSPDPGYLLPHVFQRVVEHNLRDRDNVLIFSGWEWQVGSGNIMYGNLIVDELKKSELFSDWWGNKYALQIGNSLQIPAWHSRVTLEFTAVRPWLYTHNQLVNKYSHDGFGLGFPAGSNLIQIATEFNTNIIANLTLDLAASFTRQGSVGNHFSLNYDSRPSDHADWLEGCIQNIYRGKFVVTWQPLAHHSLKLGYQITRTAGDPARHDLSLSYLLTY